MAWLRGIVEESLRVPGSTARARNWNFEAALHVEHSVSAAHSATPS